MSTESEFPITHPVAVSDLLRGDTVVIRFQADAGQCRALADFLGIPEVRAVSATLKLRAEPGRRFILDGPVTADLTQTCVVTLAPLETRVETPIRRVYQDVPPDDEDPEQDPFADDAPDLVEGGVIDAGVALCEHIALEMEPYPRAKDAPEPGTQPSDGGKDETARADNPFAVLAQMRNLEK